MDPLPWYRIAAAPAVIAAIVGYAIYRPSTRAKSTVLGAGMLALYGMAQDQISARLCLEYFTVLHNPIPGLTDPTLLGLAWGFLGAAGGGVAMGYAAGLAATVGRNPPLAIGELVRPMALLVAGVATATAITGGCVSFTAEMFGVRLDPYAAQIVPVERHRALFVVASYHLAAYVSAIVGSIALCVWVGRERARRGGSSVAHAPG